MVSAFLVVEFRLLAGAVLVLLFFSVGEALFVSVPVLARGADFFVVLFFLGLSAAFFAVDFGVLVERDMVEGAVDGATLVFFCTLLAFGAVVLIFVVGVVFLGGVFSLFLVVAFLVRVADFLLSFIVAYISSENEKRRVAIHTLEDKGKALRFFSAEGILIFLCFPGTALVRLPLYTR